MNRGWVPDLFCGRGFQRACPLVDERKKAGLRSRWVPGLFFSSRGSKGFAPGSVGLFCVRSAQNCPTELGQFGDYPRDAKI